MLYKDARAVGFTMPMLTSQHPLHDLFGPKRRQALFPNAHWSFLVHTGINLSRAFEVLHDRNIVVGDVNSNNVVVYPDSTARLIDCDSFQIQGKGKLFRCNVGVAEYQPPELQGRDFSRIERLPQHDLFGLAVMIFQLLFVGTSCRWASNVRLTRPATPARPRRPSSIQHHAPTRAKSAIASTVSRTRPMNRMGQGLSRKSMGRGLGFWVFGLGPADFVRP